MDDTYAYPLVGIVTDLPNEAYHAGPGISKSQLDMLARSPLHYRYGLDNPRPDTRSTGLGSALHMAVLEPELFSQTYIQEYQASGTELATVEDIKNRLRELGLKTGGNKAELAARLFEADPGAVFLDAMREAHGAGKQVLSVRDWDAVQYMRESLWDDPLIRDLLEAEGMVEASGYWVDEETGLACRCRPDKVIPIASAMLDLKTTRDASDTEFARSAGKYRYWVQHPYYIDGWRSAGGGDMDMFVFAAVENTPPYAAAAYELDPKDVQRGRDEYRRLLDRLLACQNEDRWPSYHPGRLTTIKIPPFFFFSNGSDDDEEAED